MHLPPPPPHPFQEAGQPGSPSEGSIHLFYLEQAQTDTQQIFTVVLLQYQVGTVKIII